MARIDSGSHVTLHYRLAVAVDGEEREVVSTFGAAAATLQIGGGHWAPPLETRLIGLDEGERAEFEFGPQEAYGQRSAELVQTLSRRVFEANADRQVEYRPGDVVEFSALDGSRYAGVLKEHGDSRVVVDFNHPLAGLPLRFSVQIIGVL
jgi:FKBP-type peptidyl-prolyl cis-trans isomerase SlpA